MSKESFKNFVRQNPELADYVLNNNATWQQLYEIYDMYGESNDIWNKYRTKKNKVTDILNKLDVDSLQEHIKNAQKALAIIGELTNKGVDNIENNIKPAIQKPINKFFGD